MGILERLFGRPGASRAAGPIEEWGRAKIPRSAGEDLLQATSERRSRIRAIRDRLEYLAKDEKVELVDRILARFALFVFDLPASERHHHARPFGLLDHSIEVAWKTVLKLSETSFRVSPDPLVNRREQPAWVYAGFLAALGHDLGKVESCEVALEDGSDRWDPDREPLAAFSLRHGRSETGPTLWRFKEGRGMHAHKGRALGLLALVLTEEAERYVGQRLRTIFEHYAPWPSGEVAPPLSLPGWLPYGTGLAMASGGGLYAANLPLRL